jgi:hypothetical protein
MLLISAFETDSVTMRDNSIIATEPVKDGAEVGSEVLGCFDGVTVGACVM